jgi:hypothetical protein
MEVLKSIFYENLEKILIAILVIVVLNTCTNTQKTQLANDTLKEKIKISNLKADKYIKRINALNYNLIKLEQSKQREKTKIVTVIKEVEKKITALGSLNTKGIATYYQERYKLPVVITQYGVSLNDTIAKKNIVELIQKDGLVKELGLTKNVLSIEEKKGTVKDSIISNKSLIIFEKDNIINSHQEIEINLNKSLRKEKVKKNFWKFTSTAILIGAGYLLVK